MTGPGDGRADGASEGGLQRIVVILERISVRLCRCGSGHGTVRSRRRRWADTADQVLGAVATVLSSPTRSASVGPGCPGDRPRR